jgi:hypothetical protein
MITQMLVQEPESFKPLQKDLNGTLCNPYSDFGSAAHKLIINSKLYAAQDVLRCGLGAFVTDVDVVFFQNPASDFHGLFQHNSSLSMVFQDDTTYTPPTELSLNSGFFYMLPGEHNFKFVKACIEKSTWWWIDQGRVNYWLARGNYSRPGSWHRLESKIYPNGRRMIDMMEAKSQFPNQAIAGHANYNSGLYDKVLMLSFTGTWLLDLATEECFHGTLPAPRAGLEQLNATSMGLLQHLMKSAASP